MANSESASIDINKLAGSLRESCESFHPFSDKCFISRVARKIRSLDETAFTPQVISIGPLHHGRQEFKYVEECKRLYLKHFLQRTKVSIEDFLILVNDAEAKLRNCFAEKIEIKTEDFVTMILLDAIFITECCFCFHDHDDKDGIPEKPKIDFETDLFMIENQLPLFLLKDLFNLARTASNGKHFKKLSFNKLIIGPMRSWAAEDLLIDEKLLEEKILEAKHFLDLIILCLKPPDKSGDDHDDQKEKDEIVNQTIPSATELHQAGVKFKIGSSKNLLEIKFNKGVLEIPLLTIYDNTEVMFSNLLAFETLHCHTKYLNDYIIMMKNLVVTAKDSELLVQNGIVHNWLGDSQALSSMLYNLDKQATLYSDDFYYWDVVKELKAYCSYPLHKWKANLKQNYFNTPWASISVIAAVILLVLTIVQTVCSIISL